MSPDVQAGGGVAEGRGGVVKLSFPTDLVSNLQPTRGMKRRRECRLIVELDGAVHEGPLEIERDESSCRQQRVLESLDHTTPAFGHPSSC